MSDKVNGAGYIDPGTCDIGREFKPRLCQLRHFAALRSPGYNPCGYCPLIIEFLKNKKGEYRVEKKKIGICRHCNENKTLAAKGLCWKCYEDKSVREKYSNLKKGPQKKATGGVVKPDNQQPVEGVTTEKDVREKNNIRPIEDDLERPDPLENATIDDEKLRKVTEETMSQAKTWPRILSEDEMKREYETGILSITTATALAHKNALIKGWHEPQRQPGELIALMHSELSEALEEIRNGRPVDEIYYNRGSKKPEGVPVELADCVIRIMDFCGLHDIDLAEAITTKMDYNETRPKRHGGKVL